MDIEEFITVFEWIVSTFLNWFLSTSSVFFAHLLVVLRLFSSKYKA